MAETVVMGKCIKIILFSRFSAKYLCTTFVRMACFAC